MKNKFYNFLDTALKVVGIGLFLFIMYWGFTFLYTAFKAIFK